MDPCGGGAKTWVFVSLEAPLGAISDGSIETSTVSPSFNTTTFVQYDHITNDVLKLPHISGAYFCLINILCRISPNFPLAKPVSD